MEYYDVEQFPECCLVDVLHSFPSDDDDYGPGVDVLRINKRRNRVEMATTNGRQKKAAKKLAAAGFRAFATCKSTEAPWKITFWIRGDRTFRLGGKRGRKT